MLYYIIGMDITICISRRMKNSNYNRKQAHIRTIKMHHCEMVFIHDVKSTTVNECKKL